MELRSPTYPRSQAGSLWRRMLRAERRADEAERKLWELLTERDNRAAADDALAMLKDANRLARFGLRCPWCHGLRGSAGSYRHKPECRLGAALGSQEADTREKV